MTEPISHRPDFRRRRIIVIAIVAVIALVLSIVGFVAFTGKSETTNGQPTPNSTTCEVNGNNSLMPVWQNDACQYVGDAFGLFNRGANKSSISTPTYEVFVLKQTDSATCGGEQVSGAKEVWLLWCPEGYFVVMEPMINKSMNVWGEHTTFGALSAGYGSMALSENGYPYSPANTACVAGEIISSLNDLGVLGTDRAEKIQVGYFYDGEKGELQSFEDAYNRKLTFPECVS